MTVSSLAAACLVAIASALGTTQASHREADTLLVNGNIVTVDDKFTLAEAVAIQGGELTRVGTNDQVLELRGPQTRVIDLGGKTVVPEFIDGHGHMDREGLKFLHPTLTGARSIDDVLRRRRHRRRSMKYTAFDVDDPDYDWTTFDFDTDPARLAGMSAILDADDPDLSAFQSSGGKMIHYHHWADTAVPPVNSINHYDAVVETMGPVDDFYKFYLVPGGFHGAPGVGATEIAWLDALVDWVENDNPPAELVGERLEDRKLVRTRKICPYPEIGTYRGSGSTDSAENFVCKSRD